MEMTLTAEVLLLTMMSLGRGARAGTGESELARLLGK